MSERSSSSPVSNPSFDTDHLYPSTASDSSSSTIRTSTSRPSTSASRPGRNPDAARTAAAQRLATAHKVAEAVDAFHDAADRIDRANNDLAVASRARLSAVVDLRHAGLTIGEVSELTGLSASRVQSLIRGASVAG